MTAPKEVKKRVERLRENRDAYLSSEYNETQLRREFLDPLFKTLGSRHHTMPCFVRKLPARPPLDDQRPRTPA